MTARTFTTATEDETIALGAQLAAAWPRPCVVLLIGNLGAGKTTMAKGIAEGLDTAAEVASLGLDEIFSRPAVVLLEWAERFPALLPRERIEIRIEAHDDESRIITVTELT